jgi:hypothetical protein
VTVNNVEGEFFQTVKGLSVRIDDLRGGGELSFLFIFKTLM